MQNGLSRNQQPLYLNFNLQYTSDLKFSGSIISKEQFADSMEVVALLQKDESIKLSGVQQRKIRSSERNARKLWMDILTAIDDLQSDLIVQN